MDSAIQEIDVLVLGSSASTYISAILLAKYGIRCQVIAQGAMAKGPRRFCCLQPRTLEILQTLRLKVPLDEQGNQVRETASWTVSDGRLSQESIEPWTDPDAAFPYDLVVDQGSLDKCLENCLSSHGIIVSRLMDLVKLQYGAADGSSHVLVHAKNRVTGCIEKWRTRFVIASVWCDNNVRSLSGIPHSKHQTTFHWMSATVEAHTDFPDHRRRAYIWSHQKCLIILPGKPGVYHLRILLSAKEVLELNGSAKGNVDVSSSSSIATWEAMTNILGASLESMLTPYKFAIRQVRFIDLTCSFKQAASQFSDQHGCTFLLGNSSHTNSLSPDHHVNSGIADAWSLSWKLALVCKGKATRPILSTHSTEQQPSAISPGQRLETNFHPEHGNHVDFQKQHTFVNAYSRRHVPNILIREEVRNVIKENRIAPGKLFNPITLTRHSSGEEVSLLDEFPINGKFHLLIMAGTLLAAPIVLALCSFLSQTSSLWSLDGAGMAGGDESTIPYHAGVSAEVYLIHSIYHLDISLANLCSPFTGSDRVYEDVGSKAHQAMGINDKLGALVLLRPDLVISIVTNLDNASSCAELFRMLKK